MAKEITKKYYFSANACDMLDVDMQVSKKEFDRMMRICEGRYNQNDMVMDEAFKVEKYVEEIDNIWCKVTRTRYTLGTTDFTFIFKEAAPGFAFKR